MAGYGEDEIEAIAGWLGEQMTATQVAARFTMRFRRRVSRNAIIGIVHRNERLRAIGLARVSRSASRRASAAGAACGSGGAPDDRRASVEASAAPFPTAVGGKGDRPSRLVARPAGAPGGQASDAAREAEPFPREAGQLPRTIADMIFSRNAAGAPLSAIGSGQCRFPVGAGEDGALFCAAPVSPWLPGSPHGCYCRFHRDYLNHDAARGAGARPMDQLGARP